MGGLNDISLEGDQKQGWVKKLQNRWGVSASRVFIILLVFALTGFSVMFLKKPIVGLFVAEGESNVLFSVIYYILILPVYNLILLIWGFVFGQFRFFLDFEKRFFNRIFSRKK